MAYRKYTSTELRDLALAMAAAATAITNIADKLDAEDLSPSDFQLPTTFTKRAMDKVASDAQIQLDDLIHAKRTGQVAEYLKNKMKNDRKAKKFAAEESRQALRELNERRVLKKSRKR